MIILEAGQLILNGLESLWWLLALIILVPLAHESWLAWRQEIYKSAVKYVLLEIRIPPQVKKSPKAMEQILAQIHSLGNYPMNLKSYNLEGEVTLWFSLDVVSFGGEIHFYLRLPQKHQEIVETAFFSYYPDLEIVPVKDYLEDLPQTLFETYQRNFDFWGTEFVLGKEDIYPLKTYQDFEGGTEKEFDPISVLLEVLAKVKKNEFVALQFICLPSPAKDWKERGGKVIQELKEKGSPAPKESLEGQAPQVSPPSNSKDLELAKLIEKNIEKPAFKVLIRAGYFSARENFSEGFVKNGLKGALNQYSGPEMNFFNSNGQVETKSRLTGWPYLFPRLRASWRKQRMLFNFSRFLIPPQTFIGKLATSHLLNSNFNSQMFYLNTQVLATLFHPPLHFVVTSPHIKELPSRKLGAPAGLPIFGEEEERLKKFELK